MRSSPAVKRELPPDSSSGARSSTSTRFAVSFADSAAHKAALPPPTTITSYSSLTPLRSFSRSNDSIRLDPGGLDDLAPFLDLAPEELVELLRPHRIHHRAQRRKLLPYSFVFQRLEGLRAQPRHGFLRRLRRSEQSPPDVGLVAGDAGFGEGRDLGQHRQAPGARDPECAQPPRLD